MAKREALISFVDMSNAFAPNLVGEPLIQVIGESVTQPSTTPELFTPPIADAPPPGQRTPG